jgi:hypothetical protein
MKRRREGNFQLKNCKNCVIELNEVIGIASRRVFQSQLLRKNASAAEIHSELPELCSFIKNLWQNESVSCIRELFRHPEVQWLTRSAMTSGITSILCSLLLEQALTDKTSKKFLLTLMFLDAVLTPCNKMLLVHSKHTCEWRHHKPKYHQMECFKRWDVISPFLSRLIIQSGSFVLLPQALSAFERDYLASSLINSQKINCWFAQIVGFLRLIMSVPQVSASILKFLLRWRLLITLHNDKENCFFYDLLMEKFFREMRELAFKKSSSIESGIHEAFPKEIADAIVRKVSIGDTQAIPSHHLVLTVTACTLSKELPVLIMDELLSQLKNHPIEGQRRLIVFLQGLCGHVNLIPIEKVLDFFQRLILLEQKQEQQKSFMHFYMILYVFVHRVDAFENPLIRHSMKFLQFQQEILECIQTSSDLLSQVPVPLLQFFLNKALDIKEEEDIEVFLQEIEVKACFDTPLSESIVVPFAELKYLVDFVHMKAFIIPHFISLRRDLLRYEKRRKPTSVVHQIHRKDISIVLMPEILEHIFGFLSHKRLCRMALVCQTFHFVSQNSCLWKQLYQTKWPQVFCEHELFVSHRHHRHLHPWKEMYQQRFKQTRRMIKRRNKIKRHVREVCENSDWRMNPFTKKKNPVLCTWCGCNHILMSEQELKEHLQLHREFQCQVKTCRMSCLNKTQLKRHLREAHSKTTKEE